jgi:hypothetical protein
MKSRSAIDTFETCPPILRMSVHRVPAQADIVPEASECRLVTRSGHRCIPKSKIALPQGTGHHETRAMATRLGTTLTSADSLWCCSLGIEIAGPIHRLQLPAS